MPSRPPVAWILVTILVAGIFAPLFAQPATAALRGVLLDAEGLPAVAYQVGLRSAEGDLFLSAPATIDGHFNISDLPAGRYRLVAFDEKGAEFPVLSEEITLKPGTVERLEIRISGTSAPPGRAASSSTAPAGGAGRHLVQWWKGFPLAAKVGVVAVGAFAVYQAVDSSDPAPERPVSPSAP
ncbi:MAG: carboxypeptidase-like regulatory domain-containing protein [Acidobacteriota bacterium]|nr:carboxypeptidase-like regulatory domain-containing protein [Acidobacteriota bacterium]MDQ7087066.1 carboxypeptidase-like regulatory domain-containing protein [Acidobacteriota bacterium]